MSEVDLEQENNIEYAGFWVRTAAAILDSILVMLIIAPILTLIYGGDYWFDQSQVHGPWHFLFNYVFPAIAITVFWIYKSATPGKMAIGLTIVDAKTGKAPSVAQCIIRYLGYYLSMIPLFLGIFWVGIDRRKQGWHDKIAGTVVIATNRTSKVTFEEFE